MPRGKRLAPAREAFVAGGRRTVQFASRTQVSAPAFVYVAPALHEDILKIGFSHDPCARVRSFHPRWFEYFDLPRGFVLTATDEGDARRIERLLGAALREHRASLAPLVIERAAGGFTEWYRGAQEQVARLARELVDAGGYAPLISLDECLRQRLLLERDDLFERSIALVDAIDALGAEPRAIALRQKLHDMLDAYAALGIDVHEFLSVAVSEWLARESACD